jgi:hypothetical protein
MRGVKYRTRVDGRQLLTISGLTECSLVCQLETKLYPVLERMRDVFSVLAAC